MLRAGAYALTDAITDDESAQVFIREVVLANPAFFAVEPVRVAAGVGDDMVPAGTDFGAVIPSQTPPMNEQTQVAPHAELPVMPDINQSKAVGAPRGPQKALAADGAGDNFEAVALVVASEASVRRALELAGGRLLTASDRGKFQSVPRWNLHSKIRARDAAHCAKIMNGGFEHLEAATASVGVTAPHHLRATLESYCQDLLLTGTPHEGSRLMEALQQGGVV